MLAVEQQNSQLIDILLAAGANINAQDQMGNTALTLAVTLGHNDIVEQLQKAGGIIENLNELALFGAVDRGDRQRVESLLQAGVNPNIPEPLAQRTALVQAAFKEDLEIVKMLIAAGADINQESSSFTPLTAATYYGNTEIVKFLLEVGADVKISSIWGGNALELAESYDYTDIIELLISAGTDCQTQEN